MDEAQPNPDHFKFLDDIGAPDRRNSLWSPPEGLKQMLTEAISGHYANVAQIRLAPEVPQAVQIHFDTGKNLYLYGWFVYRFFPVAEHQALTCLELGLRMRFPDPLPKKYWDRSPGRRPTLRPLLKFAADLGLIKNEGFRRWQEQVQRRAQERYSHERLMEMIERNLDQIEMDYGQAVPNEQDRDWDYLAVLLDVLPEIRNLYAHGSTMLHNQVLGTMELVAEILNQLFRATSTEANRPPTSPASSI